MKKNIKMFLAVPVLSGAIFLSCNSNSDKTDSSSSTTTDSSSMMKKDTGTSTMSSATDTSKMKSTTTTSKKKGKVSTIMMAASEKATATMNTDPQGYYNSVEVLPTYPGGQSALDQYINDNVTYPEKAIDDNKEGTVIVSFGVDENGKVTNAKITSPVVGDGLEEEALNVINKMPAWTAGTIKGKKVKSHYSLPIRFQLEQ